MIKALIILLLLVTVSFSLAQDQGQAGSQEEEQSEPEQTLPTVWPPPFHPSQEVGADSQISFPTDI